MWHVTSYDDVKRGRVTDVYFQRALETLRGEGIASPSHEATLSQAAERVAVRGKPKAPRRMGL